MRNSFVIAIVCCLVSPGAVVAQSRATYNDEAADVWLARLKDTDYTVQVRAAYALGQIEPPSKETLAGLMKAVDDRAQEVRWYSADSLGRLGPAAKEAVSTLLKGVKDPANDKPFQRTAAHAFGRIGPEATEAIPWLLKALQDDEPSLKAVAALALWRINKHPNVLPALREMLAEPSGEASSLASLALLELGLDARAAAPDLERALEHPSADARRAAARVLGKLGPELITPLSKLLERANGTHGESVIAALSYLIDDARRDVLYNPRATAEEFAAVEKLCVGAALPALVKLFDDPNEAVRSAAALAAAKSGLLAIGALVSKSDTQSETARRATVESLTRLADYLPSGPQAAHLSEVQRKSALPLITALKHRDASLRAAALALFAELSCGPEAQAAAPLLREALKSEDARVRRNAVRALERLKAVPAST